MAEKDERTEEPTARRKAQARAEGQVFKSQEVLTVGMLLIGVSVLVTGSPWGIAQLESMMSNLLLNSSTTELNLSSIQPLLSELVWRFVLLMLPFLAILLVAGIVINVAQSGWNFTFKPLQPKSQKVSPLKGIQRLFSKQGIAQFLKSFLKILIVGPIAYFHIAGLMSQIVMLHTKPLMAIFSVAGSWIIGLFAKMMVVLVFLAIIDFFYEKWRFKDNMKMSKQEVKDERKQQDGDPKVKKERQKLALRILRRARLDKSVADADVVITNPTHYAVALKYDPLISNAPRVVAKGIRKRALRIRELAIEQGVTLVEEPPLARALYKNVAENHEIPEDLYHAVATILAEVYRDKKSSRHSSGRPARG